MQDSLVLLVTIYQIVALFVFAEPILKSGACGSTRSFSRMLMKHLYLLDSHTNLVAGP